MNKTFIGKPIKYNQNNTDFIWALCRCPLPANYGIRIPREKGVVNYHFKCEDCGTEGVVSIKYQEDK